MHLKAAQKKAVRAKRPGAAKRDAIANQPADKPAHQKFGQLPMGLVRVFTGCGAADIANATIFGHVNALRPVISIKALP